MQAIAQAREQADPTPDSGPLSVVFADAAAIKKLATLGEGELSLVPPFHISDEDSYLIVPDDIGMEIVDILRDADGELLHETLRDSLVAVGNIERRGRGQLKLDVESCHVPQVLLRGGLPYMRSVLVSRADDPVRTLNTLDHTQCTMLSALVDEEGLDRVLRRSEYIGVSWKAPACASEPLQHLDPTYVWSRRLNASSIGIELALFQEYDELIALLRPAKLLLESG
ncbi:MAG: hypothetical protein MJD61_03105 [Proteobacteria bacterium]|nr:hypothetical protein [Pseudomonadota bacterium]